MSETFGKPFTKAEIEAMRRMAREEAKREGGSGGTGGELPRKFFTKLKRVGQKIPFAEDILAAYFCAVDPATPSRVKLVLLGAIAYFVLPVDGIADFLPLLGFTDDAAVIAAAIAQVAGSITEAHRDRAREVLKDRDAATEAAA